MRRLLAALGFLLLAAFPASAQMSGVRVVAACGTPSPWPALSGANIGVASSAWLTVDPNYNLCVNGLSGGGGLAANIVGWGGGTLGAMANYGTSPGAVLVPGVNAFVTNASPAPANDVTAGPSSITGAATLAVSSQGAGSVGMVVSGTFTGAAWTLQGSVDGTTYATIPFWDNTSNGTIYTAQPSATATGTFVAFAAGYKSVRINVTAVSTGTLVVTLNSSAGSAQHPVSTQGVNSNINGVNGSAVTIDPCTWKAKTNLAISTNATSLAQIIAANSTNKIYVCSLSLIAAGATAFNLNTGTGSNCGSSTAALLGSTTAANGLSFATNGGLTLGNGGATVLVTAASSEICTVQSNSVFVSGSMTYVQQ